MKRWLLALGLLGGALSAPAWAERYWVSWEGNDYPENEGWERIVNGPQPAERSLHDGVMTMDGLADRQIDDYYRMERPIDPGPGETFVMQWRLRVDEVVGNPPAYDPGVDVFSDDDWTVSLLVGVDFVFSFHEGVTIPITSGAYHSILLKSADMRRYSLFVDDVHVHEGTFWEPTVRASTIDWGDRARGSASLSDWDYVRFGVVPEPTTVSIVTTYLFCTLWSHRSKK